MVLVSGAVMDDTIVEFPLWAFMLDDEVFDMFINDLEGSSVNQVPRVSLSYVE